MYVRTDIMITMIMIMIMIMNSRLDASFWYETPADPWLEAL